MSVAESALQGVIAKLHRGEKLSEEAIDEIQRVLDGLRAEGWSGLISADAALRAIVVGRARGLDHQPVAESEDELDLRY